jgi:hypothetical protein
MRQPARPGLWEPREGNLPGPPGPPPPGPRLRRVSSTCQTVWNAVLENFDSHSPLLIKRVGFAVAMELWLRSMWP